MESHYQSGSFYKKSCESRHTTRPIEKVTLCSCGKVHAAIFTLDLGMTLCGHGPIKRDRLCGVHRKVGCMHCVAIAEDSGLTEGF